MKMRNICLEDVFVETFLLITAVVRAATADTDYELAGAIGSLVASSCIAMTTSILVFDKGIQCACYRNKPICTSLCCCWENGSDHISDKTLLRIFNLVSLLGICGAVITIITEAITFFDVKEIHNPVMSVPGVSVVDKYIERDHAIIVICIQCIITLPWRIYTYKVSKGVLGAIHCAEVLQFQASYKADALRNLLPDTGLMYNVDLAHECDVSRIARIYCNSFSELFSHIGLPEDAGPSVIEAHWRSRGDVALARWLSRVGVIRDETGKVVAALSLQLPGDIAEYEQLEFCYKHDYEPVLLNSNTPLPKPVRTNSGKIVPSQQKHFCCTPENCVLGLLNSYRFKYKHAIISEHVCTPGEAYIDFLCVDQAERREGSGRRLIKWAEESAEKLGCGRIAASVWGGHTVTHEFYKNLGFHQTDQKTDIISYCLLQLIFCFSDRFFDWEKSLGQEKGLAIFSNKYGFTSERLSESDDMSSMNGSIHQGALNLLAVGREVVANAFVRSSSSSKDLDTSSDLKTPSRRRKYSKNEASSVERSVLDRIMPPSASSSHSTDESSHHNDFDTSSRGLLGGGSRSSEFISHDDSKAFDPMTLLSGISFNINAGTTKYSTLGNSSFPVPIDKEGNGTKPSPKQTNIDSELDSDPSGQGGVNSAKSVSDV